MRQTGRIHKSSLFFLSLRIFIDKIIDKMKISEKQLRNIIRESLEELRFNTVGTASDRADNISDELIYTISKAQELIDDLKRYGQSWEHKGNSHAVAWRRLGMDELLSSLQNFVNNAGKYYGRKLDQAYNLSNALSKAEDEYGDDAYDMDI